MGRVIVVIVGRVIVGRVNGNQIWQLKSRPLGIKLKL